MSVVGLHPEELFDKEARNALSDSERVRLLAHVAQCSACRIEREMRADFADEMAADDSRISVSALLAFAKIERQDRALASSDQVHVPDAPAARAVKAPRRRMMRMTWLLAAAAVFAVSVAGATGVGQRAWSTIVEASAPVATVTAHATPKAATKHVAHHASLAPVVAPAPSVDVLVAPTPVSAPVAVHASTHAARATREGAAGLFDSATDARRHGEYARALALHRELESRFPNSREAHVARATAGRLLLDLGDPAGALKSFDEYLASGSGELGEETMVGRATALERLGRADDARRAWQALLAAYPDSPYAAHAMRRLGSQSVH